MSPLEKKWMKHEIRNAFTAVELDLAEQLCAAENLRRSYQHLRDIPLYSYSKVEPMILRDT